jgi:WD40 repeat protein
MTCLESNSRLGRALAGALFAAALAMVPACGSKDQRPLVVVDVPLGTYAGAGTTVKVTVVLDGAQVAEKSVLSAQVTTGKIGIYLPSGSSGSATVTVTVSDASGCVIASGSSTAAVAVKAGEISATVSITLLPAGPCVGAGVDASVIPPVDGGAADGPGVDAPGAVDTQSTALDGVAADARSPVLDVEAVDTASLADVKADVAVPAIDVAVDVSTPDLPTGPDLGPDGPVDAPATTMNVLANCKSHTHVKLDSTGKAQDWGIRQLAFSPDGTILVSFGEDGRAKLWNVTAAGLSEPSSGLIFTGDRNLSGTISYDGKLLAVGDTSSKVEIYDLATSLQFGAPSKNVSLPPDTLDPLPYNAARLRFTTDGGHLAVVYSADGRPDPNQLAVWDLGTQQITRLVKYDYDDWPMTILPGAYTGFLWVASAASLPGDGGGYVSTVTLMDVLQLSPSKAQVTIPGEISNMAFSPDGTTLAIGFETGEVSLWDITNKSNIVRLGSPLVAGSTSSPNAAYALAYTPDGRYLAAGIFDYTVRLITLQSKQALQKDVAYLPWAAAFAPDGLALAVGERDFGVLLYCRP